MDPHQPELRELLAEQAAYYRARAPEYDRWFQRIGRFDRGPAATAAWSAEVDEVRTALATLPLDGAEVLELASGTGLWTEQLAGRAGRVTAVDASPEMHAEALQRLGSAAERVDQVVADLFSWRPGRTWDVVVFCFWVSHLPRARLAPFLHEVAGWLRPGGSVFFVDNRRDPASTAADHVLPEVDEETMVRRLDDGREFRIVKNFWTIGALSTECAAAGLDVRVRETATFFQYGVGQARAARSSSATARARSSASGAPSGPTT